MQLQRVPGEFPGPNDVAADQLAQQGIVVLSGALDEPAASAAAARVLAIAATGARTVTLRLNGVSGSVAIGLMLHDVVGACGAEVRTIAGGTLDTAGAIVLAAGDEREISPTARIHLTRVTEPSIAGLDVERGAEDVAAQRSAAEVILQTSLDRARMISAAEAVEAGIADIVR